jgi:hypothetical protein
MFYYKLTTKDGEQFCGHCKEFDYLSALKSFLKENPNYNENNVDDIVLMED